MADQRQPWSTGIRQRGESREKKMSKIPSTLCSKGFDHLNLLPRTSCTRNLYHPAFHDCSKHYSSVALRTLLGTGRAGVPHPPLHTSQHTERRARNKTNRAHTMQHESAATHIAEYCKHHKRMHKRMVACNIVLIYTRHAKVGGVGSRISAHPYSLYSTDTPHTLGD